MTWVVGFNGFNGVLCVADVQVTFAFHDKSRTPLYRNCLKKVHRIWDNAYVAFSGDVRTGLLVIADLRDAIAATHKPGSNFTLEDQVGQMQQGLRTIYQTHARGGSPELELMFAYVHQPGKQVKWSPGLCRFIAPDFRFNSSAVMQLDQCGSGKRSPGLQVIAEFLAGRRAPDAALYNKIFQGVDEPPIVTTIKKARTLLTSEAALTGFAGVSDAFCSVMAETGWDRMWPAEDHATFLRLMTELGMRRSVVNSRADALNLYEIDFTAITARLKELSESQPAKFARLQLEFTTLRGKANFKAREDSPRFVEEFHPGCSSAHVENLCATWEDMKDYMRRHGIPVGHAAAIA